jgi:hypothetical protein
MLLTVSAYNVLNILLINGKQWFRQAILDTSIVQVYAEYALLYSRPDCVVRVGI